jgi:signal transduction histidine kinase
MRNQSIAFRARARTIDHLGKGQIADCPTAVSELWKNSYDAYARNVILHTFDGDRKCGVIADNGCGMTIQQLIQSWLVVGTEAKTQKKSLAPEDMFGLPARKTQGEKGIGRLSAAFLAPTMLMVSRKVNSVFCAALIDWRMFENSYLSLEDISVPVAEFDELDSIGEVFASLKKDLMRNLCVNESHKKITASDREKREAWQRFSADETRTHGRGVVTTEDKILEFGENAEFSSRLLSSWLPLLNRAEESDGGPHGTALFLFDLERDLALLTNPGALAKDNQEVQNIRKDLVDTLRAFADPFVDRTEAFQYEIKTYTTTDEEKVVLAQGDNFDYESFSQLEHLVQGHVDERGYFVGTVRAFGKDLGIVNLAPAIEIDRSGSKVGPFTINIGTFEMQSGNTSLSDSEHAFLLQQAKKYAGLMIFRDGLRVLPYGRVDNDFFEMEEKRSLNAGRYYWSKRRIFGQILITQDENSLLKDKAGREGFIKNQAARELKSLVSSILDDLADRFFGARSAERRDMLNILKREREARKEAQNAAKRSSQRSFINEIKTREPLLKRGISALAAIEEGVKSAELGDAETLDALGAKLVALEKTRVEIRTPIKPPDLGDNEDRYRQYRDLYEQFSDSLPRARAALNEKRAVQAVRLPMDEATRLLASNQAALNAQLAGYVRQLESKVGELLAGWQETAEEDGNKYGQSADDVVRSVGLGADLALTLNSLDSIHSDLADRFAIKYEPIIRALERLSDGINLDFAFSMAEEEKAFFEEKARNLQALAQLGISVEILAHEMEEADAIVTRGLNSLPKEVKALPGYIAAMNAHKSLTHQIRFLSPLKLSGYQVRREITGLDIREHIEGFFGDRFDRQKVKLKFGEKFLSMKIKDIPSRIYPVFTNLINNALYWVCLSEKRRIVIGIKGDDVIVANSGPPVDEDDIPRLFDLFYTRRSNGHGVGLYLCKENLAVARHKIRYSGPGDQKLIPDGANFLINFNGMEILQ